MEVLGDFTPRPPPLRESFPRAMVRYLPPRAGVVHGTLLLVTYVMYAVVGRMGLPHPNIWECLAAL
jgi:hypothetical protein